MSDYIVKNQPRRLVKQTEFNPDSDLKNGVIQWGQKKDDTNEQSLEFRWVKRLIYIIPLLLRERFYNTEKGRRSIKAIDEDI